MLRDLVPCLLRYGFAISLVLALTLGSLLHGTIAHTHVSDGHGHEHSYGPQFPGGEEEGAVSIIWQMLHGALRHEEKHALLLLALIDILLLILIARATTRRISPRALWPDIEHGFTAGRWLTAGLAPYRRFA